MEVAAIPVLSPNPGAIGWGLIAAGGAAGGVVCIGGRDGMALD